MAKKPVSKKVAPKGVVAAAPTKIKYVVGDMFGPLKARTDDALIVLPHCCNNVGAWGAGFVVPLGRNYPQAQQAYLDWPKQKLDSLADSFVLGGVQNVRVNDKPQIHVFNMVAQTLGGMSRPLRYDCLAQCMMKVVDFIRCNRPDNDKIEIHAPMFGSNLAGGDWNFIEQLVIDTWCKRSYPVTIYYMPGTEPKNWTPPKDE